MSEIVQLFKYDMSNIAIKAATGVVKYFTKLSGEPIQENDPGKLGNIRTWHTSIVVYDVEYSYGKDGVITGEPGSVMIPTIRKKIGYTDVTQDAFEDYVRELRITTFGFKDYKPTLNDCNKFSNALCQYLLNKDIPLVFNTIS